MVIDAMDRNGRRIKAGIVVVLVVIVAVAVYIVISSDDEGESDVKTEYDIQFHGPFALSHADSDTYVQGQYYIVAEGGNQKLTIIADVHVGPEDFGGVSFDFYYGTSICSVSTDAGSDSSSPIGIWTNGESENVVSSVRICRGTVEDPFGSWSGLVVIEADLSVDSNYFSISAGSSIGDDGTPIIGSATLDVFIG